MPNDGYSILNGRLIARSIVTRYGDVEVCRFTVPENTDMRINTMCLIQNQSTASDGYSYWLDALVTRQSGNATIIGGLGLDGYGSAYNASGVPTEMTIAVSTDGYDLVFTTVQTGTDAFRLSTYSIVYQVDNNGIMAPFSDIYSLLYGGTDEYTTMGSVFGFERTDSFSIMFWARWMNATDMVFTGKNDTSGEPQYLIWTDSSGFINASLVNVWTTNKIWVTTTSAFNDGYWHQIGFTYDGSSDVSGLRIYVDGADQARTEQSNNLTGTITNNGEFQVGKRSMIAAPLPYTGKIDELAVYDKELSAPEVAAIYHSGTPVNLSYLSSASNLIGWWRMGDGDTYPTILDHSGSGFNGTMTNMEPGDIVLDAPPGYAVGVTIDSPEDGTNYNPNQEYTTSGTIVNGDRVVSFSADLVGGDAQFYEQIGDTWSGDGLVSGSTGDYDLTVTVTYDNAEVRTAVVTISVIAA